MSSNVIISILNSKYIHSSLAPWCLFTSAKANCEGIALKVIEGTINENLDIFCQRIITEKPDILSFSCYIWNIKETIYICKKVKEVLGNLKIVLGGPEVAYNCEDILSSFLFVDYILSGEGESSYPDLINAILKNESLYTISGLSFRENGKIVSIPESDVNLDTLPSPYCEEYFETLKNKIAYIESSRGCPFSCAFCLSGRCSTVRFFPLERVKEQMLLLCSMGAKTIKFVDRTFNCNKKRAKEILLFIKENYGKNIPNGVCFHFEIAADLLDESLFSVIETLPVGSVQFEVGIQSFNTKTLEAINRKTDLEAVVNNVERLLRFSNCHIHIDLIAGLPFENYQSFIKGFNKAYKIGANMLQLGFLKVLHGSEIEKMSEKYSIEYSPEAPYEVLSTADIANYELELLHIAENELERLYNSSRFKNTLDYLLKTTSFSPYELMLTLGLYLIEKGAPPSVSLIDYIGYVFEFFSSLKSVDKDILRDTMLIDRIATNNSDIIPPCLKVKDERLSVIKAKLKKELSHKGALSVGILYSTNEIIYCTYQKKHPITGAFEYNILTIDSVLNAENE